MNTTIIQELIDELRKDLPLLVKLKDTAIISKNYEVAARLRIMEVEIKNEEKL